MPPIAAALAPWEAALESPSGDGLWAWHGDGVRMRVPIARWRGTADAADRAALARAAGPVLDVGCGPGRHLEALARLGVPALGVDLAPAALRLARGRGVTVVRRDVFGEVPWPGRWATVLLLDGNVGIGGDPVRLLRRCAALLARGGRVLCELEPPGAPSAVVDLRLEHAGARGASFRWATLAVDRLPAIAATAGLRPRESWSADGRWFAVLSRPP